MSILPLRKYKDVASHPPIVKFEPKSQSQQLARELFKTRDVLFFIGPAGTGKTLAAVGLSACDVIKSQSGRDQIVVVRPAIVADRELGFIKGSLEEKLAPLAEPVLHNLGKVAFHFPAEKIHIDALGYLRGKTFDHTCLIVDECQNLTYDQFLMVLSRIGKDSKILFCGDPCQSDLHSKGKDLMEVMERVENHPSVGIVRFKDNESIRNPLISEMLRYLLPR